MLRGEAKYQWPILISIFCASLILKLVVFSAFYRDDVHQLFQPDFDAYLKLAIPLLKQGNYDDNLSAIIIAQLVLSVILIFYGYLIARRLFDACTELITALFFCCRLSFFQLCLFCANRLFLRGDAKPSFLFGVWILTESNPKYRYAFLLRLFFAIATLIRPVNYYLLFPSVAGLFI
ncbi:hypothetical protein [Coxiella endosymbiont of Ornithodoros maritimus]|uniref:hypothetical protein n=1 Tax=Coxiella endosymbiont of Ornithodoros maritimus TaxID=1656172 RepID=UPI002264A364|nr:hypothetical protein [Coxiella endosymbiont of Ornithodoros maritimus]